MGLVTTTKRDSAKTWLLWGRKANTAGGQRIKVTAGPRGHCNAERRARGAEGWTDLTVEPSPE